MGKQVTALAESEQVEIAAGIDVNADQSGAYPVYPSFSMVNEDAQAIIDFSRPEGLGALLGYAKAHQLPCDLVAAH